MGSQLSLQISHGSRRVSWLYDREAPGQGDGGDIAKPLDQHRVPYEFSYHPRHLFHWLYGQITSLSGPHFFYQYNRYIGTEEKQCRLSPATKHLQ